jgi:TonB family protein
VRLTFAVCALLFIAAFQVEAQTIDEGQSPTTVIVRPISNTQRFDFAPYLQQVRDRVRSRWDSRPGAHMPGRVVIWMSIDRNGSARNIRVMQSSNMAAFDQSVITAINLPRGFPSLPAKFAANQLTIELEFTHVVVGLDPTRGPNRPFNFGK